MRRANLSAEASAARCIGHAQCSSTTRASSVILFCHDASAQALLHPCRYTRSTGWGSGSSSESESRSQTLFKLHVLVHTNTPRMTANLPSARTVGAVETHNNICGNQGARRVLGGPDSSRSRPSRPLISPHLSETLPPGMSTRPQRPPCHEKYTRNLRLETPRPEHN